MKLSLFLFLLTSIGTLTFSGNTQLVSPNNKVYPGNEDSLAKELQFMQFPNVGLNWRAIYEKESERTLDSIRNWVVHLHESPQVIRRIVEVCGKYFYQLPDSIIRKELLKNIDFLNIDENNEPSVWLPRLAPIVNSLQDKTSSYWNVSIWDEDFIFYKSPPYQSEYSGYAPTARFHLSEIQDLSVTYDSVSAYYTIPNFFTVYIDILDIKNNDELKISLLYSLMEQVYVLGGFEYLKIITEEISSICNANQTMSNQEKAESLVGCGKVLATADRYLYGNYIASYFSHAEGLLRLDSLNAYYYNILKNIKAQFLINLPGEFGGWIARTELLEDITSTNLSVQEQFKKEVLLGVLYLFEAYVKLNKGEIVNERIKLLLAIHIEQSVSLYRLLQDRDWIELDLDRKYYSGLLALLTEYYWLEGEFTKALKFSLQVLKSRYESYQQFYNTDYSDILRLREEISNIGRKYIAFGDSTTGVGWLNVLCDTCEIEEVKLWLNQFPSDPRFFTNKHLEKLSDSLQNPDVFRMQYYTAIDTRYARDILRTQLFFSAKYQFEKKNFEQAYTFLKNYIDINSHEEDIQFYSNLSMSGTYSKQMAEKRQLKDSIKSIKGELVWLLNKNKTLYIKNAELRKKQDSLIKDTIELNNIKINLLSDIQQATKTLESKNFTIGELKRINHEKDSLNIVAYAAVASAKSNRNWAYIGAFIAAVGAISFFIQRKKAIILANYNNYKSKVWQEMGHIPGTSIDDLCIKLKKRGLTETELLPLIRLKLIIGGLFTSLVKGDDKKGNLLKDEIELTKLYVDYKNDTTYSSIKFTHDNSYKIKVPPALLLSCIRNAIEHGKLLDKKDAQIHLNIEDYKAHHQLILYNNGNLFKEEYLNKKNIKASSTGFRNMNDVLTYFNGNKRIKNPVDWNNIDHKIYKVQTQLKVKK